MALRSAYGAMAALPAPIPYHACGRRSIRCRFFAPATSRQHGAYQQAEEGDGRNPGKPQADEPQQTHWQRPSLPHLPCWHPLAALLLSGSVCAAVRHQ
jgi:hypothetical protein